MQNEENVIDVTALVNTQDETPEAPGLTPEELDSICDDMALRMAIGLRDNVMQGDCVLFILINPTFMDGVTGRLFAMTEEAFPQAARDNIKFIADSNMEKAAFITLGDLEEQFLRSHFTANGFLPNLSSFFEQSRLTVSVGGEMQTLSIPVQVSVDTLRTLYILEMRERFKSQIVVPPMGARIDNGPLLRPGR